MEANQGGLRRQLQRTVCGNSIVPCLCNFDGGSSQADRRSRQLGRQRRRANEDRRPDTRSRRPRFSALQWRRRQLESSPSHRTVRRRMAAPRRCQSGTTRTVAASACCLPQFRSAPRSRACPWQFALLCAPSNIRWSVLLMKIPRFGTYVWCLYGCLYVCI